MRVMLEETFDKQFSHDKTRSSICKIETTSIKVSEKKRSLLREVNS